MDDAVAVRPERARPGQVIRVHHVSPRQARPVTIAGHWIHHHRQQATNYSFADLPSFIVISTNEGPAGLQRLQGAQQCLFVVAQVPC
ncbi:hypothetical protein [Streptomyces griseocarneus]|uniref:hypothetical protein n=1 Tax=Streptomyces griseocarneus TaxID=51201 RepID=UPI00167F015C|nr:hypothetical protein [Streptomyces griseocarneus]MBZ6476453.1 hypothetical protein [Streptomyces griseocarneus]